jgi:hypothetical protein
VLATARLLNQALALLSPLLLVRRLEITEYGRHRQFMATGMFITSLAGFALAANLHLREEYGYAMRIRRSKAA